MSCVPNGCATVVTTAMTERQTLVFKLKESILRHPVENVIRVSSCYLE